MLQEREKQVLPQELGTWSSFSNTQMPGGGAGVSPPWHPGEEHRLGMHEDLGAEPSSAFYRSCGLRRAVSPLQKLVGVGVGVFIQA